MTDELKDEEQGSPEGTNVGDESGAPVKEGSTGGESVSSGEKPKEGSESPEFVKDAEGKEYVPKEAFEKRLASEVGKRKEAEEFAESIRSNPDTRKQYYEKLKEEYDKGSKPEPRKDIIDAPDGSKWKQLLASYPEEQRSGLIKYAQAMAGEIAPFIKEQIDQAVSPLVTAAGESAVDKFLVKVPAATEFLPQIHKYMDTHKSVSLEDAYKSVAFDSVFAKGKAAQKKETETRQTKTIKSPITKDGSGVNTKPKVKSIEQGVAEALDELGYK